MVSDIYSMLCSFGFKIKAVANSFLSQSHGSESLGSLSSFNGKSVGSGVFSVRSLGSDHSSTSADDLFLPHEVDVDSVSTVCSLDVRGFDVVSVSSSERFPGVDVFESRLEARLLLLGSDYNGECSNGKAEFH